MGDPTLKTGSFTCPHCAEVTDFEPHDLHSGCTFYCEHCGKPSVIEPQIPEERSRQLLSLNSQAELKNALHILYLYKDTIPQADQAIRGIEAAIAAAKGGSNEQD